MNRNKLFFEKNESKKSTPVSENKKEGLQRIVHDFISKEKTREETIEAIGEYLKKYKD